MTDLTNTPRPDALIDGLQELLRLRPPTPSCATCQHYSGDGCADTRKHPMQHKGCPPEWGCPLWEA